MYNPSRGGVRGGADQFTWESVKTDKHRENYLGHSVKAPVGRWQKGKDLSWYAKERKDGEDSQKTERSELAAIKRAEEEAMLTALGQKVVRRTEALTKEEMVEALKRNVGERDELNIERIDGVGASSRRTAMMGSGENSRHKNEGVDFIAPKGDVQSERNQDSVNKKHSSKKKSKKNKKEKKSRKNRSGSSSESEHELAKKHKKHKRNHEVSSSKHKKKSKHKSRTDSSSESDHYKSRKTKSQKHRTHSPEVPSPKRRRRHDTSESD